MKEWSDSSSLQWTIYESEWVTSADVIIRKFISFAPSFSKNYKTELYNNYSLSIELNKSNYIESELYSASSLIPDLLQILNDFFVKAEQDVSVSFIQTLNDFFMQADDTLTISTPSDSSISASVKVDDVCVVNFEQSPYIESYLRKTASLITSVLVSELITSEVKRNAILNSKINFNYQYIKPYIQEQLNIEYQKNSNIESNIFSSSDLGVNLDKEFARIYLDSINNIIVSLNEFIYEMELSSDSEISVDLISYVEDFLVSVDQELNIIFNKEISKLEDITTTIKILKEIWEIKEQPFIYLKQNNQWRMIYMKIKQSSGYWS